MLQSKIIDVGRLTYEGSLAGLPCPATGARERSDVNGDHRLTFVRRTTHGGPRNNYAGKPLTTSQRARCEVENSIFNLPANKYMIQALMIVYGETHRIVATYTSLVSERSDNLVPTSGCVRSAKVFEKMASPRLVFFEPLDERTRCCDWESRNFCVGREKETG